MDKLKEKAGVPNDALQDIWQDREIRFDMALTYALSDAGRPLPGVHTTHPAALDATAATTAGIITIPTTMPTHPPSWSPSYSTGCPHLRINSPQRVHKPKRFHGRALDLRRGEFLVDTMNSTCIDDRPGLCVHCCFLLPQASKTQRATMGNAGSCQ